jgi:hypothetical protein
VEFTIIIFGSTVRAIVDLPRKQTWRRPGECSGGKEKSVNRGICIHAPEKDTVDEYFLHASAASQQEQTAGPGAWDQIRAREGIVAVFHL